MQFLGPLLLIVFGLAVAICLIRDVLSSFGESLTKPLSKGKSPQNNKRPNWKALEEKIGVHSSHFLYVGRTDHINIYKNLPTRMYLYVDDAGGCYARGPREFELANLEEEWRKIAENPSGFCHSLSAGDFGSLGFICRQLASSAQGTFQVV